MIAVLVLAALLQTPPAPASTAAPALPETLLPRDWLVLPAVDATGRRPFNASAPFARYLLDPSAAPPRKDEALAGDLGATRAWTESVPDEQGRIAGGAAWAYTAIESRAERVMIANLQGAARLYVNGAGFVGDLYAYGFRGVPVALRAGRNDVYVSGIRGGFRLELWQPKARVVVGEWDVTRPSLIARGKPGYRHVGVTVMNASLETVPVQIESGGSAATGLWFQRGSLPGPTLPPLCVDKPLLELLLVKKVPDTSDPEAPRTVACELAVDGHAYAFELDVVGPLARRRVTYPSRIDGSAQECSVLPALEPTHNAVLTLHGAGVDAFAQAGSYAAKKDFHVVAPTNRRPFGFDWQDWGRADAYEALAAGIAPGKLDEARVFLTGHSMGGHGTWHLAANDPTRFVAIAPSAGWAGFDSYGGGVRDSELARLWRGADGSSDTLALAQNLVPIPTYVLHGEKDDNVPLAEARRMEARLKELGATPALHVQPEAGHWWDGEASPGADCVDWPGIFELFRAAKPRPIEAKLDAVCADPGVQAVFGWCEFLQPREYGRPMRVTSQLAEESRDLAVTTDNVAAFKFHVVPTNWRNTFLLLDGQRFEMRAWEYAATFVRTASGWRSAAKDFTPARQKSRVCSGPFKRAFDRGFVLCFGTAGDAREDAELLARARCDAETWWYRGNGSARVVSDEELVKSGLGEWIFGVELGSFVPNVILYGNADTNSAWKRLLGESVVQARRGSLRLGEREWRGEDLAAVVVAPRRDAQGDVIALVGAFADTGVAGTRLGYVLSPFASGVGYPDYAVFGRGILEGGDAGVLAAGFLDVDWKLTASGFVRPPPPEKR